MEPKFQSSFIPKKPIITGSVAQSVHVHSVNIFSLLATVIFVITILVAGGGFIYKNVLIGQIATADKNLAAAREAFQPEKIQELIDANAKIMVTKELLEKHVVVSELLAVFQELTVKKMRFSSLVYTSKTEGLPALSIDGETSTYNAMANQQDIFSKNEFLKEPKFSDFALGENGTILVKFFTKVDPRLVSYKKMVESLSINQ